MVTGDKILARTGWTFLICRYDFPRFPFTLASGDAGSRSTCGPSCCTGLNNRLGLADLPFRLIRLGLPLRPFPRQPCLGVVQPRAACPTGSLKRFAESCCITCVVESAPEILTAFAIQATSARSLSTTLCIDSTKLSTCGTGAFNTISTEPSRMSLSAAAAPRALPPARRSPKKTCTSEPHPHTPPPSPPTKTAPLSRLLDNPNHPKTPKHPNNDNLIAYSIYSFSNHFFYLQCLCNFI